MAQDAKTFGIVFIDIARSAELYGQLGDQTAKMLVTQTPDLVRTYTESVHRLKGAALLPTRSLGQVYVKGKRDPVEIVELLWNTDATNLTVSAVVGRPHGPPAPTQIRFEQSGGQRIVRLAELPISIGRSDDNQIMVLHHEVFRKHAVIESQANMFVLRDQSTNGTQLQIHGHAPLMLHRSQTHLTGSGRIVLGRNPCPDGSNSLSFSRF